MRFNENESDTNERESKHRLIGRSVPPTLCTCSIELLNHQLSGKREYVGKNTLHVQLKLSRWNLAESFEESLDASRENSFPPIKDTRWWSRGMIRDAKQLKVILMQMPWLLSLRDWCEIKSSERTNVCGTRNKRFRFSVRREQLAGRSFVFNPA